MAPEEITTAKIRCKKRSKTVDLCTMMASKSPTLRFSDRVENYARYRPTYSPELVKFIQDDLGFSKDLVGADVGSGTGILTLLLLSGGNLIYAVEPNEPMRNAAEECLRSHSNFRSVAGTAEDTSLPESSVDFVFAAQAFHWFDPIETKAEFERILKPGGTAVILWNLRKNDSSEFARGYEQLLISFGTDYQEVKADPERMEPIIKAFFKPNSFKKRIFLQAQNLDFKSLKGRLESSSYCPREGEEGYKFLTEGLENLFRKTRRDDQTVAMEYETVVYWGKLTVLGLQPENF